MLVSYHIIRPLWCKDVELINPS